MGACDFIVRSRGKTAKEAFNAAVDEAQYEYGHAGYTGTIAEKGSFIMISLPEDKSAIEYAEELIDRFDHRIDDKWGPAGCIKQEEGVFVFFGWASS